MAVRTIHLLTLKKKVQQYICCKLYYIYIFLVNINYTIYISTIVEHLKKNVLLLLLLLTIYIYIYKTKVILLRPFIQLWITKPYTYNYLWFHFFHCSKFRPIKTYFLFMGTCTSLLNSHIYIYIYIYLNNIQAERALYHIYQTSDFFFFILLQFSQETNKEYLYN